MFAYHTEKTRKITTSSRKWTRGARESKRGDRSTALVKARTTVCVSGGTPSFLSPPKNGPGIIRQQAAATTSRAYELRPHGVRRRPPSVHAQLGCLPVFGASAAPPSATDRGGGKEARLACLSCCSLRCAAATVDVLCSTGGGVQRPQQHQQRRQPTEGQGERAADVGGGG